jgi:2-keto-3-deoxy-L-rhamnonate aldolase RhmA
MGFNDPLATSIVASAGYDFVIIDMEYDPLSAAGATQTVHSVGAVSKGKCAPLFRAPSHGE